MDEKRRLTRVQWVKDVFMQEGENNSASRSGLPEENGAVPRTEFPTGNDPAVWAEPSVEGAFQQGTEISEEGSVSGEEEVLVEADTPYDYDLYAGDVAEEEIYEEDANLLEEPLPVEEEQHPLLNAILILVALYIVCGFAPLFIALFVSLRVFFWLEIGGCVIILGWLVIGVRPPLIIWIKQKLQERKEQAGEQL